MNNNQKQFLHNLTRNFPWAQTFKHAVSFNKEIEKLFL